MLKSEQAVCMFTKLQCQVLPFSSFLQTRALLSFSKHHGQLRMQRQPFGAKLNPKQLRLLWHILGCTILGVCYVFVQRRGRIRAFVCEVQGSYEISVKDRKNISCLSCLGWIWILDAHLPDAWLDCTRCCCMSIAGCIWLAVFLLSHKAWPPSWTNHDIPWHSTWRRHQWYIISMIYQWYQGIFVAEHQHHSYSLTPLWFPNSCPRLCIFCKNTSARAGPGKVSPGVRGRHLKWTLNS